MAWQHTLNARWAALSARERQGLTLAAWALALALVWAVWVAPAWRTLRDAPAQSAALAATLERMQAMQARAEQLRAKPKVAPQDTLRSLQAAASALGKSAQLQVEGEQATLTLQQVSAQDLATWLAPQAAAGLSPVQARLQRDANAATALWSGVLVFRLAPGAAP